MAASGEQFGLSSLTAAWAGVTAACLARFQQWRLTQGDAPATLTVYCRLAASAGMLNADELAGISLAPRYSCPSRANMEMAQPDTPQGLRDTLLMCLLLEQGLRVGEVVRLDMGNVDLARGTL